MQSNVFDEITNTSLIFFCFFDPAIKMALGTKTSMSVHSHAKIGTFSYQNHKTIALLNYIPRG